MTEDTTDIQQEAHQEQEAETREPEHAEAAEQEESATSDDSADAAADSEGKKSKGVQKRIDELTANWRNTERDRDYWRQLAMQKAKQEQSPPTPARQEQADKPVPDNFDSDYEYMEALADWKAEQKWQSLQQEQQQTQQQRAKQETVESFHKRAAEYASEHPDFNAVAFNPSLPVTEAMEQAIVDSDMGPQVLYHLGQNPDEAARLAQLNPYAAAREIGRIEHRLSIPPKPRVSQAPDPIKPVGGSGEGRSKTPDEMSTAEWMAWRNKQLQNR